MTFDESVFARPPKFTLAVFAAAAGLASGWALSDDERPAPAPTQKKAAGASLYPRPEVNQIGAAQNFHHRR